MAHVLDVRRRVEHALAGEAHEVGTLTTAPSRGCARRRRRPPARCASSSRRRAGRPARRQRRGRRRGQRTARQRGGRGERDARAEQFATRRPAQPVTLAHRSLLCGPSGPDRGAPPCATASIILVLPVRDDRLHDRRRRAVGLRQGLDEVVALGGQRIAPEIVAEALARRRPRAAGRSAPAAHRRAGRAGRARSRRAAVPRRHDGQGAAQPLQLVGGRRPVHEVHEQPRMNCTSVFGRSVLRRSA